MQSKLKIAAIIIALCGAFTVCHAQQLTNTVNFSYDLNGNRVLRQIVIGGNDKGGTTHKETANPVTEVFETVSLTLFPNPTDGRFSIRINGLETPPALRATITTTTGAVICDKLLYNSIEDFDLTQQPAGIYLLRLTASEESHTWKVIKK